VLGEKPPKPHDLAIIAQWPTPRRLKRQVARNLPDPRQICYVGHDGDLGVVASATTASQPDLT
jgi:hypothetical protein